MALFGLEMYLLRTLWPGMERGDWALVGAITVGYLLVASAVTIKPDMSNLGLFGGVMDNPLTISDDVNRFMLTVQMLLMPGRLAVWSLASAVRLLFGK